MTSTRQHLVHLLKYYPRRPCAPSLIKSRFFRSTTNLLTFTYIFTFLKFLISIHAGASRVPPQDLASGPKPCGGNDLPNSSEKLSFRMFADDTNIFFTGSNPNEVEFTMNEEI